VARVGVRELPERALGGFQVHDDAREALDEGVVDLPRQPLALPDHARPPRLLDEPQVLQRQRRLRPDGEVGAHLSPVKETTPPA
jgi:hypothetical protein